MATLRRQWDLAANNLFSQRMVTAAATVAFEVLGEADTVPGYPFRRTLAMAVLNDPDAVEHRFAVAVVTDDATYASQVDPVTHAPLATNAADAALLARVRAVWSVMSGFTE